jgi:hypothetical protein
MARLERGNQPNRKRNRDADRRAQPEHATIDLSGQVQHISRKKQNQRMTAPVRH